MQALQGVADANQWHFNHFYLCHAALPIPAGPVYSIAMEIWWKWGCPNAVTGHPKRYPFPTLSLHNTHCVLEPGDP